MPRRKKSKLLILVWESPTKASPTTLEIWPNGQVVTQKYQINQQGRIARHYDSVAGHNLITEARSGIDSLVEFANAPESDPLHQRVRHDLSHMLRVMSRGKRDHEERTDPTRGVTPDVEQPGWIFVSKVNLASMVEAGRLHFRCCGRPSCDAFFVSTDARKHICSSPQCRLAARADRARRNRKARRDLSKAPLHARDVRRKNARV